MILLVDGSNVLGAARGSDEARRHLVRQAAGYARSRRCRAILFFDGAPQEAFATSLGGVRVRFSGERDADDLIVAEARNAREPVVVITRDGELRSRVQSRIVRVESPQKLQAWEPEGEAGGADGGDWESWFSDPSNRSF